MAGSIPLQQNQRLDENPEPTLLPGEIIVAQAKNVLRFDAMADRKSGISGVLYVTNFRVTFLTKIAGAYCNQPVQSEFQSNPDLNEGQIYAESQQELHMPLTCIFEINYTVKSLRGTKTKKLVPGLHISSKVEMIEIRCKDLRVLRFGLRFTPKQQRKPIVDSILHYAYPSSVALTFAFSFSRVRSNIASSDSNSVPSFRKVSDWLKELSRLNMGQKWRIAEVNTDFHTCPSLSALIVCPASVSDGDIDRMALLYNDARIPVWCWSHPKTGVSLLYSAGVDLGSMDFVEKEEASFFRQIVAVTHDTNNKGGGGKVVDVTKSCASVREIQQAFQKLKELCVLDTTKIYWSLDSHWLSSLDNTRWQSYVRISLSAALEVAQLIYDDGRPVILRETGGQDMVFVIGSLAQLMLDAHYRTISGFQLLIQKMWVAGGHPFTHRCGHVRSVSVDKDEYESQESPVFLHFLDCVFQLLTQFPSKFEFSETYLLELFDGMLSCMFDTFLFNNECQRKYLCNTEMKGKPMVSLWDFMTEQLSDSKVASIFRNPLYEFVSSLATDSADMNLDGVGIRELEESYLKVNTSLAAMRFWAGFFLRWLPVVRISTGLGKNSSLRQQQTILKELKDLRHRLADLQRKDNPINGFPFQNEDLAISGTPGMETSLNTDSNTNFLFSTPKTPFIGSVRLSSYSLMDQCQMTPPPVSACNDDNGDDENEKFDTYF